MKDLNLILEITEHGYSLPIYLMSPSVVEKHIRQFSRVQHPTTNFVTFECNGNIMRLVNKPEYIRKYAHVAADYGMTPVFKTSSIWGGSQDGRTEVLNTFAAAADEIKSPVTIDMEVAPANPAANIASDVASSLYLSNAIQLSGFAITYANTAITAFKKRINELGWNTLQFGIDGTIIIRSAASMGGIYAIPVMAGDTKQNVTNVFVDDVFAHVEKLGSAPLDGRTLNNIIKEFLLQKTK